MNRGMQIVVFVFRAIADGLDASWKMRPDRRKQITGQDFVFRWFYYIENGQILGVRHFNPQFHNLIRRQIALGPKLTTFVVNILPLQQKILSLPEFSAVRVQTFRRHCQDFDPLGCQERPARQNFQRAPIRTDEMS